MTQGTPIVDLYGRQVIVRIIPPNRDARELRGLRVSFKSKKAASKTPATCTISIYNPAPDTVALAQDTTSTIELWAGYSGRDPNGALNPTNIGVPRLIWRGNPVKYGVTYESQPPDRILQIECADGGAFFTRSRVNISFSTQTTPAQVIEEALRQAEIPRDTTTFPTTPVFPGGFYFSGKTADLFSRIADATGNQWYVRDGSFVFAAKGVPTANGVLVSPSSGLIGSPSPKDNGTVELRVLLHPSIRVGSWIQIESEATNGTFTVQSIEFSGDSGFSSDYYMDIIAVRRELP